MFNPIDVETICQLPHRELIPLGIIGVGVGLRHFGVQDTSPLPDLTWGRGN